MREIEWFDNGLRHVWFGNSLWLDWHAVSGASTVTTTGQAIATTAGQEMDGRSESHFGHSFLEVEEEEEVFVEMRQCSSSMFGSQSSFQRSDW